MPDARARAARDHQAVRRRWSRTTRSTSSCAGRDPRAARGERRGQVDADERPLRAPPARRGRDPARRRAGRDRLAAPGDRLGIGMVHQHFMLVPVMTVAENLVLGAEPQQRAAARLQGGRGARARALGALRARGRPRRARRGPRRRRAAARGDPARAVPRREGARARRADRGADRAGGAGPVRACCARCKAEGTAIVFISHKLNEVLDVADRVTVLRRGKKIDTVPTEGATERSLARLMVGRDVLLRVEKAEHKPGEPLLEVAGVSRRATTAGCRRSATSSLEVRAGEIVGLAGVDANGQSELIEAITGLRTPDAGHDHGRRQATSPHAGPRDTLDAGVGHIAEDRHRRGLVLEFDLAENLAPARVPHARAVASAACSRRSKMVARARSGCSRSTTCAAATPETRAGVAVGRQPAEGRDRARARRRPAGAHRRAADARARRRRDRVRPPPAGRGARRGPRRPARLARARGDPLAERSRAGDLRGRRSSAELPPESSEEDFGVAMTGGGREGGRGVSDADPTDARGRPEAPSPSPARLATYLRGGGIITPLITVLLAFFVGGLVVLRHRPRPDRDLQGDLRRHRAELVLPVDQRRRTARSRR